MILESLKLTLLFSVCFLGLLAFFRLLDAVGILPA